MIIDIRYDDIIQMRKLKKRKYSQIITFPTVNEIDDISNVMYLCSL